MTQITRDRECSTCETDCLSPECKRSHLEKRHEKYRMDEMPESVRNWLSRKMNHTLSDEIRYAISILLK